MHVRAALTLSLAVLLSAPGSAWAADLPPIKLSERNAVPECTTPGRLTAFLQSRNATLDPAFGKVAVEYMRIGEELGVRWDYAFYQMVVETGYLTFKRDGGRSGEVRASQNNFAGLGATGRGQQGESFKDVATGVRAHLQHVLMYSGETIESPVAERTRTTQMWLVRQVQNSIKGPVTFSHLAQRWAASSEYAGALATHAARFEKEFCGKADPHPELVAEARGEKPKAAVAEAISERVSGRDLAKRAIDESREGGAKRVGLGAAGLARPAEPTPDKPAGLPVTIINPSQPEAPKAAEAEKPAGERKPAPFQTASAAGLLAKPQKAPQGAKCKVFTASYGGQKAVIIQAPGEAGVNFTVLDVNEGNEKREADAYIAAYAKGGSVAGEFASHTQAIDKAFELCPEG